MSHFLLLKSADWAIPSLRLKAEKMPYSGFFVLFCFRGKSNHIKLLEQKTFNIYFYVNVCVCRMLVTAETRRGSRSARP